MSRILYLSKLARERGTYPIKITVRDSNRVQINSSNISAINFWLTDTSGNIINGRANVVVSIVNPFYIVLTDEDLQITNKNQGENTRILTIRGVYDSDVGSDLPFTYSLSFTVLNELVVDIDLNVSVTAMIFTGDTVNV